MNKLLPAVGLLLVTITSCAAAGAAGTAPASQSALSSWGKISGSYPESGVSAASVFRSPNADPSPQPVASTGDPVAAVPTTRDTRDRGTAPAVPEVYAGGASLLVRTDFSDDAAYKNAVALATAPQHIDPATPFQASLEALSDRRFTGWSVGRLVGWANGSDLTEMFVADSETIHGAEHTFLVIDLHDKPGRSLRVIPSEMWSVQNNLSLANMDFVDFSGSVDADGVFRGFK